jgi:regulator of sirC expression with transglutaminase-like and TPR domain
VPSDPIERFARVISVEPDALRLDEAALCLSAAVRHDEAVDVDGSLARLDDLAGGIAEPTLDGLRRHLFAELGFAGDEEAYHDPRNSFLDVVVERRRGLPITLSVLTIEVGRRAGVPLAPIGMPGHFLVRDRVDPTVFVDPYHRGTLLGTADCRSVVERLHPGLEFEDRFLDPVPPSAVLVRMLANLAGSYRRAGARRELTTVLELRSLLPAPSADDVRELALLLAAGGRYDVAADRLDSLGGDDDARTATRLRARLN